MSSWLAAGREDTSPRSRHPSSASRRCAKSRIALLSSRICHRTRTRRLAQPARSDHIVTAGDTTLATPRRATPRGGCDVLRSSLHKKNSAWLRSCLVVCLELRARGGFKRQAPRAEQRSRRRRAGVPPAFRTRSAPVPHPFRTRSAPVPHRFRTGSAPVPPPFFRSLRHVATTADPKRKCSGSERVPAMMAS